MGATNRPVYRQPALVELTSLLEELYEREDEARTKSGDEYDQGREDAYGCAAVLLSNLLKG